LLIFLLFLSNASILALFKSSISASTSFSSFNDQFFGICNCLILMCVGGVTGFGGSTVLESSPPLPLSTGLTGSGPAGRTLLSAIPSAPSLNLETTRKNKNQQTK